MKRLHIMLHLLETELHDIRSFSVFHNVIAKPALIIFILLGMFNKMARTFSSRIINSGSEV